MSCRPEKIWTLHTHARPLRGPTFPPRGDGSALSNPSRRRKTPKKLPADADCLLKAPSGKCYTPVCCHLGRPLRNAAPPYHVRRRVTCANSVRSLDRPQWVGDKHPRVEQSCNACVTGGPSGAEAIALRWYEMRCPYCGSAELLRSRSVDPWYLWLLRPLLVPIRCGRCTRRFHRARLRTFFASNVHSF